MYDYKQNETIDFIKKFCYLIYKYKNIIENRMENLIVKCPHCLEYVLIEKLNCCIFRHGIHKHNYQQIHPHLSYLDCQSLIQKNEIYGCGKPFQIIFENNEYIAKKCDYI